MDEDTNIGGEDEAPAPVTPGYFNRGRLRAYGILAGTVVAGFIIAGWLVDAAPGFQQRRIQKSTIAPLLAEARKLKLTYDEILLDPDKAMGRPALWCIQYRGEEGVFYNGDPGKKLFLVPSSKMPPVPGYKHEACREMLVVVAGFKVDTAVPGVIYIYVKFIAEP